MDDSEGHDAGKCQLFVHMMPSATCCRTPMSASTRNRLRALPVPRSDEHQQREYQQHLHLRPLLRQAQEATSGLGRSTRMSLPGTNSS